jgi:signal transduction histidine kinase
MAVKERGGAAGLVALGPDGRRPAGRVLLRGYVAAVSVAGSALLAVFAWRNAHTAADGGAPALWLCVGFVFAGELLPIRLPGREPARELTTSITFAFALLLGWGTVPAVLALAAASAAADLALRKPIVKVPFNAAQYALALAAAGAVYDLAGGARPFGHAALGPAALAVLAFFVVNHVLVALAVGLSCGFGPLEQQRRGLWLEAWTTVLLVSMSPAVLVLADRSLPLLPTLALPLVAVYLASRDGLHAEERRAAAEQAAAMARAAVAEQARLVEAEQALVRQLQEADRLKTDLLATVSHELRTPLTSIKGALGVLGNRAGQLSLEELTELAGIGVRQADRLERLIHQLLVASRFERTGIDAGDKHPLDAAALVRQAGEEARASHPERPIAVVVAGALPVVAAPDAILQILTNLIGNAAKYSPEGTVIRVLGGREGSLAVLAVEDAGPGVPAGDRHRVFERFIQLDASSTRRAGGVGLGLYIARQLAQAQGGELVVADAVTGGGARFELRLPLRGEGHAAAGHAG